MNSKNVIANIRNLQHSLFKRNVVCRLPLKSRAGIHCLSCLAKDESAKKSSPVKIAVHQTESGTLS